MTVIGYTAPKGILELKKNTQKTENSRGSIRLALFCDVKSGRGSPLHVSKAAFTQEFIFHIPRSK